MGPEKRLFEKSLCILNAIGLISCDLKKIMKLRAGREIIALNISQLRCRGKEGKRIWYCPGQHIIVQKYVRKSMSACKPARQSSGD